MGTGISASVLKSPTVPARTLLKVLRTWHGMGIGITVRSSVLLVNPPKLDCPSVSGITRGKDMKVTKDLHVTVKEGDLELHMGKALSSFHYKGQEKFVFRTAEIEPLAK